MSLLEVHNLTKYFGGLCANDDISFTLEQGELLGLIGPNGAGKTTLFNCICGYYPVTSGRVIFDGEDITNLRHLRWQGEDWRGHFRFMLPQVT